MQNSVRLFYITKDLTNQFFLELKKQYTLHVIIEKDNGIRFSSLYFYLRFGNGATCQLFRTHINKVSIQNATLYSCSVMFPPPRVDFVGFTFQICVDLINVSGLHFPFYSSRNYFVPDYFYTKLIEESKNTVSWILQDPVPEWQGL